MINEILHDFIVVSFATMKEYLEDFFNEVFELNEHIT